MGQKATRESEEGGKVDEVFVAKIASVFDDYEIEEEEDKDEKKVEAKDEDAEDEDEPDSEEESEEETQGCTWCQDDKPVSDMYSNVLCDSCHEDTSICTGCHQRVLDSQLRDEQCRDCRFEECVDCGECEDRDDMVEVDDKFYCTSCSENYSDCSSCGERFESDEIKDDKCWDCRGIDCKACEIKREPAALNDNGLCRRCKDKVECDECDRVIRASLLKGGKCTVCREAD